MFANYHDMLPTLFHHAHVTCAYYLIIISKCHYSNGISLNIKDTKSYRKNVLTREQYLLVRPNLIFTGETQRGM